MLESRRTHSRELENRDTSMQRVSMTVLRRSIPPLGVKDDILDLPPTVRDVFDCFQNPLLTVSFQPTATKSTWKHLLLRSPGVVFIEGRLSILFLTARMIFFPLEKSSSLNSWSMPPSPSRKTRTSWGRSRDNAKTSGELHLGLWTMW